MAIRKIVQLGDEALRKKCREQTSFGLRLWILLKDMAETMTEAEGVGLAAPQVGILRRVVVIDVGEGLVELINPEIIRSEGEVTDREGCLSLLGRVGMVKRPQSVTVRAQNRKGEWFEITGEDFFARALCHELDHLDGRLYTDIMEYEVFDTDEETEETEDTEDTEENADA